MALTAIAMMKRAHRWAAANKVSISKGSELSLRTTFVQAEDNIRKRVESPRYASTQRRKALSKEVDRKLNTFLRKMLAASPDYAFYEHSGPAALKGLCPGFWPFC